MRILLTVIAIMLNSVTASSADTPVAPNGISLFKDFRSWKAIAPSYRDDRQQIRIVLGNPIAYKALSDKQLPLPDGSILAKVAWTASKHPKFPVAIVPDSFVQVEFMVKDTVKYSTTAGWGFARFVGNDYKPYGKDSSFVQECFGCHMPVKSNDYLFTGFAPVP